MEPAESARTLGIALDAPWADVRRAYRARIRIHHPDRTGDAGTDAVRIIEAYRVLDARRTAPPSPGAARPAPPRGPGGTAAPASTVDSSASRTAFGVDRGRVGVPQVGVGRVDADTLWLEVPADEAFRWLTEAAHDIGEITYVDRSVPIFEVLCRFVGEPATSLVVTLQGRADGTDAFCTAESIEARPGPPTAAVVDVYEHALRVLLASEA